MSSGMYGCYDRMCGADDCVTCHGSAAHDYYYRCKNCSESYEECECGDFERDE